MDILDKKYKVKKFLNTIFREIDFTKENIRTLQTNKNGYTKVSYFADIDELTDYSTSKYSRYNNTYFQLATTDGAGGTTENLLYRYCLAFDFDKKDLGQEFNHKDIINKFRELKIYCHAIVDSGNGYHAYVLINRTNKLDLVQEVQEVLCNRLGADKKAILSTQILRIPYTFNVKENPKIIKIIHLANRNDNNFKVYDIEFLHNKNCKNICVADNKKTVFTLNNTNIPRCIANILNNGTQEGDRYKDLCNIVVALRNRNKDIADIKEVCKEWALKSNYNDNLDYRIEHIYNNKKALELDCKECKEFAECYNRVLSDFDFDSLIDEDGTIYNTYLLEDKITKKIKNKQNRSGNMLNGNEILILNVLKNEYENPRPLTKNGMDLKLLMSSITYKKKSCLSEKTVRETLKNLLDKKYILEDVGAKNKRYYKFNPIKANIDNTIKISYFATIMCICRNITPSELSLYILLRYIHKEQCKKNKTNGNIIQINQVELANKFYGVNKEENQGNISEMINNLIECKILDIYNKEVSKNNGFEYNIYRLNS
ncbi:hypothetical protein P5F65_14080 [Clostridium perfringens]|nr:hypothetical protein [Clostridium perfringens]